MTLSVDLFYSYRSPYSYLALPRIMQLVAEYDLTVNLRPVYPLAVRVPGFFKRTNPKFLSYVALDSTRVAEHENIPYGFPRPDPIVQDRTTLEVPAHQPYIHRLTRLGAAAQIEGKSLSFTYAITKPIWDGSVAGWTPLLPPIPTATKKSSPATSRITPLPAIGACPPSCSRTKRSSARTALISWSGGWKAGG